MYKHFQFTKSHLNEKEVTIVPLFNVGNAKNVMLFLMNSWCRKKIIFASSEFQKCLVQIADGPGLRNRGFANQKSMREIMG